MSKAIVIVDEKDNVIGFEDKFKIHKVPVKLHRAISILIYNKDRSKMLITRRALTKPTWGGYWSNAVCTHPYPNESYQAAAERRLFEELGIETSLKEFCCFTYEAGMDDGVWGEHELDHVFSGVYEGEVIADPDEISEYKWVEIQNLRKDIKSNPKKYSPWFKIILRKLDV